LRMTPPAADRSAMPEDGTELSAAGSSAKTAEF
jgi:hypothetical protein